LLAALAVFAASFWRGASYDASNRCPAAPPDVLRGVAVEVRVGTFGDRALVRGENGTWGFVAAVGSGEVAVGDKVEISGARVFRIKDFLGDGGQMFPYANLMRSRGYCFEAKRGEVKIIGSSGGFADQLRALGVAARERIGRVLPPVPAALSAGALFGGDDGIGEDLEESSRRAGLAHALALSGFNVAVFAGAIDLVLRGFMPRSARILGGAAAAWLLVSLAGLPPSGVRAALAWTVGAAARLSFRRAEAPRALLYAAFVYSWWNPLAIAFDLSLQLSLLACLGLAAWAASAAERLVGVPGVLGIREAAASTLAATVATLPLSVWSFGQISLVAPLANAALAYAIPGMMWAGFAAAAVSFSDALSDAVGSVLALPAELFSFVALRFGGFAWSSVSVSSGPVLALLGSFVVSLAAFWSIGAARRREAEAWTSEVLRLRRSIDETSG
jgi:competence protein ComEC